MSFNDEGAAGRLKPANQRSVRTEIWREVHFLWSYQVGASLIRTAALKSIGGFDESLTFYGDDTNLWMRLGQQGSVVLIPEDVIHFRLHGQKRPDDFWQFQTQLRVKHAALLDPQRRATAERIHSARAAFFALRDKAGTPGHAGRVLRFIAAVSRCPFLLASPLTSRSIRNAIRGSR